MPTRIYQYPKCSTCRKAVAYLKQLRVEVKSIDIVDAPPSVSELKRVQALSGVPLRKLFNTSGQSYREGGFGERLKQMTEREMFEALAADGKLIKRPLLVGDDFALVGFDESAYAERFAH
jgi:arsenate reductase